MIYKPRIVKYANYWWVIKKTEEKGVERTPFSDWKNAVTYAVWWLATERKK